MIAIEEAKPGDINSLIELLELLFEQEVEFDADRAKQRAGLQLIVDDPCVGRILVAREEGVVVGMVNLLFTVSTALGKRVAVLDDLVVSDAARGRGLGKMLMDGATRYCSGHGLARISLQTDVDNFTAQRLYESRGFTRSSMISYKKIL